MNRPWKSALLLAVSILLLTGCYNNSHVRTQRILEPGDQVVSGYMSANLLGPGADNNSYDIRHTGIAPVRLGLSYLGHHKGYEQGLNLGYGGGSGDYTDLIVGYDIRTVKTQKNDQPNRYGLYLELNNIQDSDGGRIKDGSVFQIRPYWMTTTSQYRNWYWGLHALGSAGEIAASQYVGFYSSGTSQYNQYELDFNYTVSSLGAGITMGNETQFGNYSILTQLDLSFLNTQHKIMDEAVVQLALDADEYWQMNPLDQTGLYISLGMAVSQAAKPKPIYPMANIYNTTTVVDPIPEQSFKYDPLTGEKIVTEPEPAELQFDPFTGEKIATPVTKTFDPFTGMPINDPTQTTKVSPYSLLTPSERSSLLIKGLNITSLNGVPTKATIQDVMDTGLMVYKENYGVLAQEIIPFEKIRKVQLEGGRKGFAKGASAALTSCGVCLGIPLLASVLTSEGELFALGIIAAPPVALGTLLYASMDRESYDLNFPFNTPNSMTDIEYRKKIFIQLVQAYIASGFPKYNLHQTILPAKP